MTQHSPVSQSPPTAQSPPGSKPLRADAQRNRARVLEVAYQVFASEGLMVPIDEIARRAGVGAGTVYRHFPTKEALFTAIVHSRLEQLIRRAQELLSSADPGAAFFTYFTEMVQSGATDKGLAEALAGAGLAVETVAPEAEQALRDAICALLTRAQDAGAVRPDVTGDDVKTLMVGCVAMRRYRAGSEPSDQIMEIVQAGLKDGDRTT